MRGVITDHEDGSVKAERATPEEVKEAIELLTTPQLNKIQNYAKKRIMVLGRRAMGRNYEDLLGEAITSALEGRRTWPKDSVDFMKFLIDAMRSISNNWLTSFKSGETFLESEVTIVTDDGNTLNPLHDAESSLSSPEDLLAAKQRIEQIEEFFQNDTIISLIIEGLCDGMSGPEIQRDLDISNTEYETAKRRMRRKVSKMMEEEGSNV